MTAVVDTGIVSVSFQIAVGYVCPCLAPYDKLFLAVPTFGDGILSAELGAFGVLAGSLQALLLCFGGRHIHFLAPNLIRILLLPSVRLRCLKLSGSKAPFLAVFNTEIFFFGLVLPLASFIQRTHRQQNVGVGIVTGRVWVVNCYIGAHPVCNKTFLNKIR